MVGTQLRDGAVVVIPNILPRSVDTADIDITGKL